MQGYSTVNGGNRTNFKGSWSINGDSWPTMNLEEPSRSAFNGVFSLADCYEKDYNKYESWTAICGTWTSYNKSITSNIVLKKVSSTK